MRIFGINRENIIQLKDQFLEAKPFQHVVIDDFFDGETARAIAEQFPSHSDSVWTVSYDNPVEKKKACSHWDKFPPGIYKAMTELCSPEFTMYVGRITQNSDVIADIGLHGGGMHSHERGGKLNVHKDYSLHPKLPLMRNYNLIVYMTPDWNPEWGGGLEFWSHDEETQLPKEKVVTIENRFNRAVLFNTAQNSWHGLPQGLNCPENISRKSLAVYYLSPINELAENRYRAYYAPYKEQLNDPSVWEFCEKRSKL